MTRCLDDCSATGRERLFVALAIACKDRDPERQKTLVCLLDGQWDEFIEYRADAAITTSRSASYALSSLAACVTFFRSPT